MAAPAPAAAGDEKLSAAGAGGGGGGGSGSGTAASTPNVTGLTGGTGGTGGGVDSKSSSAKRAISLWLPDGRAFGCVFVTAQLLSSMDLASLRTHISAEFRDAAAEPGIGPALADDLQSGRYQFLSSGAPITRRQEDTLTPLDFGSALMIKPK